MTGVFRATSLDKKVSMASSAIAGGTGEPCSSKSLRQSASVAGSYLPSGGPARELRCEVKGGSKLSGSHGGKDVRRCRALGGRWVGHGNRCVLGWLVGWAFASASSGGGEWGAPLALAVGSGDDAALTVGSGLGA